MKLLVDSLLVFLVMLVAAGLVAWTETGDSPSAPAVGTEGSPTNLASLLGLR